MPVVTFIVELSRQPSQKDVEELAATINYYGNAVSTTVITDLPPVKLNKRVTERRTFYDD